MKAKDKNIAPASLNEAIVSVWRRIGFQSVGGTELVAIQKELGDEFSPARIARALAAAGVELRHPEVIECDADWRERQIAERIKPLASLTGLRKLERVSLKDADVFIAKLEALRLRAIDDEDELIFSEIKNLAIDMRLSALNHANDSSLKSMQRDEQIEIAEWFRVWLETPQILQNWLELRKSSAAFKEKFPRD